MPIPTEALNKDEDNEETQLPDRPQLPLAKPGPSRQPTLSPSPSLSTLSLSTPLFPDCLRWTVQDALELIHQLFDTEKVCIYLICTYFCLEHSPTPHTPHKWQTCSICLERYHHPPKPWQHYSFVTQELRNSFQCSRMSGL